MRGYLTGVLEKATVTQRFAMKINPERVWRSVRSQMSAIISDEMLHSHPDREDLVHLVTGPDRKTIK